MNGLLQVLTKRVCLAIALLAGSALQAGEPTPLVERALAAAGSNRKQLEAALAGAPAGQRRGVEYLISHMPAGDLTNLTAEYLLENVRLAYQAWHEARWKESISEAVFLNEVLPYASINERRDRWRADFHERFAPLVKEATTASEAAALLNQNVFKILGVKYSTKRSKPDQSPYESMETGMASCTGLSIILVNACRAVGVPARFAGTPRWSDNSGNHSWVEIWDGRWRYTGAAEPTGDELDKGWFAARAAKAKRDDAQHAIYATSFKRTPQHFPLVWRPEAKDVFAINVTDRYTTSATPLPEGSIRVRLRVVGADGERIAARIAIVDATGEQTFDGQTKDERFDANDHTTVILTRGSKYTVTLPDLAGALSHPFQADDDGQLITLQYPTAKAGNN